LPFHHHHTISPPHHHLPIISPSSHNLTISPSRRLTIFSPSNDHLTISPSSDSLSHHLIIISPSSHHHLTTIPPPPHHHLTHLTIISPLSHHHFTQLVKLKFLSAGGVILEDAAMSKIETFSTSAKVHYTHTTAATPTEPAISTNSIATARVVIDAMGNASPISRQIRGAREPDGICIVVGGCARGFDAKNNTYSDVIYTDTPLTQKNESQLQYFWEAFPTGSGETDRTT
jgi:hypothetical protein